MKKILTKLTENKSVFIFDFDGVIVDSMIAKGNSFANIFNANKNDKKKILKYHLINGSKSRIDKIKYIAEKILNLDNIINKLFIKRKVNEFKKNYYENINSIKLIDGIDLFLKYIYNNNCKIYIVSAAPKFEISYFLKKFYLISFIHNVYDSKLTKLDSMNIIIKENNTIKEKCIYFGDSFSDWDLCYNLKIDFCSVLSNDKSGLDRKKSFIKINDFK